MTAAAISKILKGVFTGSINTRNLPVKYYQSISRSYKRTLREGFGSKAGLSEFYGDLQLNVQAFAGAKTYQLTRELQLAKRGAKSFSEYVDKALPAFEKYAIWQESENVSIMGQAQNAKAWKNIERDADIYPKLRYSAVMDEVTSDECKTLNGLTLPWNHPVWKTKAPINHWRCRCLLEQEDANVRSTSKAKVAQILGQIDGEIPEYFQNNVGITGEIFTKDHPYFTDIPKKDVAFARRNFELPIN